MFNLLSSFCTNNAAVALSYHFRLLLLNSTEASRILSGDRKGLEPYTEMQFGL